MTTAPPTIERYRGDTFANVFRITDANGDPVNITGYTFKMTVNTDKAPVGTATQLFQMTGTLVSPTQGTVRFAPTVDQANQNPGTYWYDIQMTDSQGAIQTLAVGKYVFKQDITKT